MDIKYVFIYIYMYKRTHVVLPKERNKIKTKFCLYKQFLGGWWVPF